MQILWCDDLTRLCPRTGRALADEETGGRAAPVSLRSARHAFASFQLLAGPLRPTDAVCVRPGALVGPRGARIGSSAFDVYVAWYATIDGTAYPEALVPQELIGGSTPEFRKLNGVTGQRYAGFWIDLHVPADAVPGRYAGRVTVRADREEHVLPLAVEVSRATLGTSCCLDVSLNNYADNISNGWPALADKPGHLRSPLYRRVERGAFCAAHDHRMFLHYLPYGHSGHVAPTFAPPLAGEGCGRHVSDWSDWDRHFGGYFDGQAFAGTRRGAVPVKRFYLPLNLCWPSDFLKFGLPGYEAEWRAVGRDMAAHFRARGWTGTRFDMFPNHKQRFHFFPWDTEEVRFLEDNDLHRYLGTIWRGTFDRVTTAPVTFDYTLGTTWTYHLDIRSDLASFIDLYIAGTAGPAWFPGDLPRLHRRGRQVWSCTNSGAIPASLRAPAFVPLLMWMRDLDGYMPAWCSMGNWHGDPWREPAGDGGITFLYPGAPFGSEETFVSLRLKVQRNMLQTVDLLDLASRRLPGGRRAVQRQVDRALGMTRAAWFIKPPAYIERKLPRDWVNADYATEEPPLADWKRLPVDRFREVAGLALDLAAGGRS